MTVLLLAGFAAALLALFTADRAVKALARVRRRRTMSARLAAAAVRAEEQQQRQQDSVQASKALTSVIPAIQRPPLTIPGVPPRGAGRPRKRGENTGPLATRPGRRPARGENTGPQATRPGRKSARSENTGPQAAHPGRKAARDPGWPDRD